MEIVENPPEKEHSSDDDVKDAWDADSSSGEDESEENTTKPVTGINIFIYNSIIV